MITTPAITAPGQVVQHLVAPAVYLDHWAFNSISRDEGLARRFAAALEARGGTLAFSWVNIREYRAVTDEEQARQAERFINANFPRVFCIEVEPFRVIEREQRGDPSPEADDDTLRALAGLRADPPRVITADRLLTVVKGHFAESGERLAAIFIEQYEKLSRAYASAEELRKLTKKAPKSAGTLSVLREILSAFLVDRRWRVDAHDVMDFYHAVVPSVYCQWVLLDKDWATHVARAQRTLRDAGADQPMATVMSKRSGVERLIASLEAT